MTKWKGTDPPQYGYLGPNTDFGHFLQLVEATQGTAIITVNYGSNLAGTGGGEPAEAAAWLAYRVQGPPFFVLVDGSADRVVTEGVAWGVSQIAEHVRAARRPYDG